jgi:hypothetical protein
MWKQRGVKRTIDEVCDFDEQLVAQGAETGLTEALQAAGRDGNVYELNGALLVALDSPRAAERWASGEEVFRECNPFSAGGVSN